MAQDNYWKNVCGGDRQDLDTAELNCNHLTGFEKTASVRAKPSCSERDHRVHIFFTLWQEELLKQGDTTNVEDKEVSVTWEFIGSEHHIRMYHS